MARPAAVMEPDEDRLLRDYLRVLAREVHTSPMVRSPGHDLRTCAACGERTAFTLDPQGTWFRCSHCGEYA